MKYKWIIGLLVLAGLSCNNQRVFVGEKMLDRCEYVQGNFSSCDKIIVYWTDGSISDCYRTKETREAKHLKKGVRYKVYETAWIGEFHFEEIKEE